MPLRIAFKQSSTLFLYSPIAPRTFEYPKYIKYIGLQSFIISLRSKYCNNIYSDNKTCREIAAQIQYKKKLEAKPVLKKCRTFYQTLQKNASLYGGKHIERYENFKKEFINLIQNYDKIKKAYEDLIQIYV